MSSQIRAYKQAIADRLLGDPAFASVPVLVKVSKQILSDLAIGLAPLEGTNVIIGGFSARNLHPNLSGPYFDKTTIAIDIVENVTIGESLGAADCDDLGEIAAALLHNEPLPGADQNLQVVDWVEVEDKDYSIRRIMVEGPFGLLYQPPAIAPVVADIVAPGDQLVTLSCATVGAPIFYTLDKTYPSPGNPTARVVIMKSMEVVLDDDLLPVYDENSQPLLTGAGVVNYPVKISAGQLLRARAWLPGYGAPAAPNPTELNQQY